MHGRFQNPATNRPLLMEPKSPLIDEYVELTPYLSAWPSLFSAEAARIVAAIADPGIAVEHIGSTAVPGLDAKPVIDLQLGVARLPPPRTLRPTLEKLGYQFLGEFDDAKRMYFRLRSQRAFNVHVVAYAGPIWLANLAFRDYLRGSQDARLRYAASKRRAILGGADRLLAYSAAKAETIRKLMELARSAAE